VYASKLVKIYKFEVLTKNVNFTDLIFSATATTETVVNYFNRHQENRKTKRKAFPFVLRFCEVS